MEKQVSSSELKQLKTVKTVVRQGRVAALHLDKIEFQNGTSVPRCCNLIIIISSCMTFIDFIFIKHIKPLATQTGFLLTAPATAWPQPQKCQSFR